MLSFRNSMSLVAAAALGAAIGAVGTLAHARFPSNADAQNAVACGGSAIVGLSSVALKAVSPPPAFVRSSTYADEVAGANHEGF